MSGAVLECSGEGILVRGARVVSARAGTASRQDVLLAGGRVQAVGEGLQSSGDVRKMDGTGGWLVPGWIDIQLNDVAWMAGGARTPDEHAERVREVLHHQARRGVTGVVLATLAAPIDELEAYLRGMAQVLKHPKEPADGAFLGALVEGTFMNPANCGAHNPAYILRPEQDVIDCLLATGAVRLLNIAPEVSADALHWIRYVTEQGVVVGAGHARPHAERLREAVDAGLRYVIHLGNGPTGSSLKGFRDGGMLEESLRNDRLLVSVILDGIHVHPQIVRDWIARKELHRVIAVTDAAFALGPPEGEFEVLGVRGRRSGSYLTTIPDTGAAAARGACADATGDLTSDFGALFGSAVDMREVFERAVNLLTASMEGVHHRHHEAWSLEDAFLGAAQMTAGTPAALLGLENRGDLEPGRRADAVLLDIDGEPGRYRVDLRATFLAASHEQS